MRELEAEDVGSFRNFVRMDPAMFREFLQRVEPRIEKYESDVWLQGSPQHHLGHCMTDL